MGREIKRVALDFDWPLGKVWDGYKNPYDAAKFNCPEAGKTCFGGQTAGGAWLDAIVNLLMTAGEDALRGNTGRGTWPHPYLQEFELAPRPENSRKVLPPSKDLGALTLGLAGWPADLPCFGHDGGHHWAARKKIIVAAGLNPGSMDENAVYHPGWGTCPVCGGENIDPAYEQKRDAWKKTEPPSGRGWQVWETVTEGSPVSPVFAAKKGLVAWLVAQGHSRKAAKNFVEAGWAPSLVSGPNGVKMGIDSMEDAGGA